MKKIIALFLVVMILALLVACDSNKKDAETTTLPETEETTTTTTQQETSTETTTTATTEPPIPVDPLADKKEAAKKRAYDVLVGKGEHATGSADLLKKYSRDFKIFDFEVKTYDITPILFSEKDGVLKIEYEEGTIYTLIQDGYLCYVQEDGNNVSLTDAHKVGEDYSLSILNLVNDYFGTIVSQSGNGISMHSDTLDVSDITVNDTCTECYFPDYYIDELLKDAQEKDGPEVENIRLVYIVAEDALKMEMDCAEEKDGSTVYATVVNYLRGIPGEPNYVYKYSSLNYLDENRNSAVYTQDITLSEPKYVDDELVYLKFELNISMDASIDEEDELSQLIGNGFSTDLKETAIFDATDPDAPLFDIVVEQPMNYAVFGLPIEATKYSIAKAEKNENGELVFFIHVYTESNFTLISGDSMNYTATLVYSPDDLPEIPKRVFNCAKKSVEELKKESKEQN